MGFSLPFGKKEKSCGSRGVVKEEAISIKSYTKAEPTTLLQELASEEANLMEEKQDLEFLRESLTLKLQEKIENKKNSTQNLRAEIKDLQFACNELKKSLDANADTRG